MSETARHLVTVEEFLDLPEDDTVDVELIDGIVYTSARPLRRHQRVAIELGYRIGGPFDLDGDGPGGWWILPDTEVRFGPHDCVAPDLSGWRRERLGAHDEGPVMDVIPDWVCEVLSPTTARRDRTAKMRLYARSSVGHLWLVDPVLRTLEAYRNHDGQWLHLGTWTDGDEPAIPPFEAIRLDVGALFLPLPPDGVAEEGASWAP